MSDHEIIDGETGELVPYVPAEAVTLFGTDDPKEVIQRAAAHAAVLKDIIVDRHLYKTIGGKNHVLIEGWTTLGSQVGVFAIVTHTEQIDGGWKASAEARRLNGDVVGAGDQICLDSEQNWKGKPSYALLGMAQTRAMSRALRAPLGFIVELAGYAVTPAEEMQDVAQGPNPSATGNDTKKATQPQIARMMTLAGELDKKGGGVPEGFDTWGEYIKAYIKERWGHESRKDLTRGQIEHLMAHLEEGVPF
jgi:hypothetical protein